MYIEQKFRKQKANFLSLRPLKSKTYITLQLSKTLGKQEASASALALALASASALASALALLNFKCKTVFFFPVK
jgi:hypothetical protein